MNASAHIPRMKPETKGSILHLLHEGAEGARCPYNVVECARMLREARTWNDEQWLTVARKLRIKH